MKLYFQVRSESRVIGQGEIETPFQIGRQNKEELDLTPVCISARGPVRRLIVFRVTDDLISRRAIDVDIEDGQIAINMLLSPHLCEVRLGKRMQLATDARSRTDDEAVCLFSNGYSIYLSRHSFPVDDQSEGEFQSLAQMKTQLTAVARPASLARLSPDAQNEAVQLIKSSLRLYSEVPGTARFFASVAATVRSLIDVDRVMILQPNGDEWSSLPLESPTPVSDPPARPPVTYYSRSLVQRVVQSKQTQIFEPIAPSSASLMNLERAVAAPIFDVNQNLIAILYADKHIDQQPNQSITLLQASLIDVVAQAISSALLRQRDDQFRATTGQFFSKSVLERLSQNRDLLDGRDADVSVLFCDIRGFSRIAYNLSPTETIEWINEVLTTLSECILMHDGVVVDYWGDAVMAMFGAPETQPDHAARACRTACDMLAQIPMLSQKHEAFTKGQFSLGIGINSGLARVGNTGSSIKFKYGPLGNTVNIASRVESITKKFGVRCLISQDTQRHVPSEFCSRRIARILAQGIPAPIDIHQLMETTCDDSVELCRQYELALQEFEAEKITDSIGLLGGLLKRWPDDLPSKLLLQRCTDRLTSHEPFDPIWTMDRK